MPHVITNLCIKCLKCVPACPVNCIHPDQDDPKFAQVRHLNINPQECIDCGACADQCPAGAIFPKDNLPADKTLFAQANAAYFAG